MQIMDSPFYSFTVQPAAPYALNTVASGDGLHGGGADIDIEFDLQLYDFYGNKANSSGVNVTLTFVSIGGSSVIFTFHYTTLNFGIVNVAYNINVMGTYVMHVWINGVEISVTYTIVIGNLQII